MSKDGVWVNLDILKAVLPSVVALVVGLSAAFGSYLVMKTNLDAEVEVRHRLTLINEVTEEAPIFLSAADTWFRHLTLNIPLECKQNDSWHSEEEEIANELFRSKYRLMVLLEWNDQADADVGRLIIEIIDFVQDRQGPASAALRAVCELESSAAEKKEMALDAKNRTQKALRGLVDEYSKNYEQYNQLNNRFVDEIHKWIKMKKLRAEKF